MKPQNYDNHARYYTPHHFVFYPVVFLLFVIAMWQGIKSDENTLLWFMIAFIFILLGLLSLMMRQHYALGNQNRTVRLELRLRYYILTHKRFESIEQRLSQSQVFALRFASDEELPALVERALNENLSGDEIKRAVKNWLPDHMRV